MKQYMLISFLFSTINIMFKRISEKVIKDLKSFITVIVTIAFVVGYFMWLVEPKDFFFIVGMIFTFYFTKKSDKDLDSKKPMDGQEIQ